MERSFDHSYVQIVKKANKDSKRREEKENSRVYYTEENELSENKAMHLENRIQSRDEKIAAALLPRTALQWEKASTYNDKRRVVKLVLPIDVDPG